MDEALNPDDPTIEVRRKGQHSELLKLIEPPLMSGVGNLPDLILNSYENNLFFLKDEGFQVDRNTSSVDFWHLLTKLNERIRREIDHANKPQ